MRAPTLPRAASKDDAALWKHVAPILFRVPDVAKALRKFEREVLPLLEADPRVRRKLIRMHLPPAIRRQLPKRVQPRIAALLWYLGQVGLHARTPLPILSVASQHMVFGFLSAVRLYQREARW